MKALFIGGTGNISLAISKRLLALGWELSLLNRGHTLLAGAEQITLDMDDEKAVRDLLRGRHFDVVAEFIAYTPQQVARDIRLFNGLCGQYLFISSASVYRKPTLSPLITESTPAHNPWWQYSRNKMACEDLLMAAWREEGFPVTIVRPSHTYGPTALPLAVHGKQGVWQVLQRILQEKPILIPGDGTSLWTVTTSDDFALGFIGLMANPHALGDVVHITSDEALSWNHIHQIVSDILERPYLPCFVPSTLLARVAGGDYAGSLLGDKANTVLFDNAKLKRLVPGFHAPTRFDQGARLSIHNILTDPALRRPDPDFDALSDRAVALMAAAERGFSELSL
ncbi:MAG: NAD-dependent epimerase/dehydratase family protein [Christensenellales bacterium]